MNTIAGFRKCDLSDKELIKKVDEACDKMYQTGKLPDRNIPAQPNSDFDLILGELLIRFDEYSKESQNLSDSSRTPPHQQDKTDPLSAGTPNI